jgi:hypothetical protein
MRLATRKKPESERTWQLFKNKSCIIGGLKINEKRKDKNAEM